MLTLSIKGGEAWDEQSQTFIQAKSTIITLEHSLISISKWEEIWHKPFLDPSYEKTNEEWLDYFKCMTITPNVDPAVYKFLSVDDVKKISDYINDDATATTFSKVNNPNAPINTRSTNHKITSELIYYWMISYEIPFECQKWRLNRLLTLIHICEVKSSSNPKMNKRDILKNNAALNASRRKRLGTRG